MVVRVLNVAEKPSAAKEISGLLSGGRGYQTRAGFSSYNKVFEFECELDRQRVPFVFTSVSGHLKVLDFEDRYRKWGSCSPRALLSRSTSNLVSYVPSGMKPIENTLHREARGCTMLVLWLDGDSEGENIAYEVMSVCLSKNPRLLVKRARFSAITTRDVRQALDNLGSLNAPLNAMVEARQELDLRAGAAFTRFLTTRVRDEFLVSELKQVVSYGPCQFPTLALVVDRFLTIQSFVPQEFFVIDLTLSFANAGRNVSVKFDWNRSRLFDRFIASAVFEICYESAIGQDQEQALVVAVQKSQRTRWKPLPLATVEMQKQVSRKLGMSSEVTMQVAEKLYTQGFISYPRTETDVFSRNLNLMELVQNQASDRRWGSFVTRLLNPSQDDPVRFEWPRAGKNNDEAHPPIHPTRPAPPNGFESRDMDRLYEYIARRFLACCSVDAKGSETVIVAQVGAELFNAKGMIVERQGFYEVFIYDRWVDKDLPPVGTGDRVPIEALELRTGKTEPPPLLSESDLISLMDRHGIGTDATIAQHIQKILERGYVSKNHLKRFQPELLGLALVESYESCQVYLARPYMRAQQEQSLKQISTSSIGKNEMLESALASFGGMYELLETNARALDEVFRRTFVQPNATNSWRIVQPEVTRCGDCSNRLALKQLNQPGTRSRGSTRTNEPVRRALTCSSCQLNLVMPPFGTLHAHGASCPICRFEVVRVENSERNTEYKICPKCYNDPPSGREVNASGQSRGAFRCFNCSHAGCPLATAVVGGSDTVCCVCPWCSGPCSVRKTNLFRVSCRSSSCNFAYFFPRFVESVVVTDTTCTNCAAKKLEMTFLRTMLPPATPQRLSACIWCDQAYHIILQFTGEPRPRRTARARDIEGVHSAARAGRGRSSRGVQRSRRGRRGGSRT